MEGVGDGQGRKEGRLRSWQFTPAIKYFYLISDFFIQP